MNILYFEYNVRGLITLECCSFIRFSRLRDDADCDANLCDDVVRLKSHRLRFSMTSVTVSRGGTLAPRFVTILQEHDKSPHFDIIVLSQVRTRLRTFAEMGV